jgi:hypothetical protein
MVLGYLNFMCFSKQVESPKKSPGKYVFSRQTRDQADKVFISSEFNKVYKIF